MRAMKPNALSLEREFVEATGLYRKNDEDEFSWVARCCAALMSLPEDELNSDIVSDEAYEFASNNLDAMDSGYMIRGFNGYPLMALARTYRFNGIAPSKYARMKSLPPIPIDFYKRGDKISISDMFCLVAAPSTGGRSGIMKSHGPVSGAYVSMTAAFRELAVCFAEDYEDDEVIGYGYALGLTLTPSSARSVLASVRAVFNAVKRVFGLDVGQHIREFKQEHPFPVWTLFTRSMIDSATKEYSALDYERRLLDSYGPGLRDDIDLYKRTGVVQGGLRDWARDHGRLGIMESSGKAFMETYGQDLSE